MNFINDWKIVCLETDECSTGILKPVTRWWLNKIGRSRNYGCGCIQHDFDYRFGPKYGITKWTADKYLGSYIKAAGHPIIAAAVVSGLTVGGWPAWNKHRRNCRRREDYR